MCSFDFDTGSAENVTALQHKKKGRAFKRPAHDPHPYREEWMRKSGSFI
jgi:hypothetical protein